MRNFIRYLTVFLLLFMGGNVCSHFNINEKNIMVIIVLLSVFTIMTTKSYKNKTIEIYATIFVVFYTLFKINSDSSEGSRMIGFITFIPLIILLSLPVNTYKPRQTNTWKITGKLLSVFYIIECLIAIWERMSHQIMFKATENDSLINVSFSGFRSRGIHGHPLQNSLIVSTIMIFILTSRLKDKYKYPLWLLGYVSIMCFNARAAMIISGITLVLYLIYNLHLSKQTNKGKYILILSAISFIGFYLFSTAGLGGRLISEKLLDSSAQVRLDIWQVFNYYTLSDFLFGLDYNKLQLMLSKTALSATENFYLDWIFSYGFVFFVPFIFFFLLIIKKYLLQYKKVEAILIFITFLSIASSNNSLSTTYSALSIFYLCLILFNPNINKYWIKPQFTSTHFN